MEWQKIETAPTDGTWVLVCYENNYFPESASFRTTNHFNAQGKATWRTYVGAKINPTHWMPLPPNPKEN